jgi:hypothetical protein
LSELDDCQNKTVCPVCGQTVFSLDMTRVEMLARALQPNAKVHRLLSKQMCVDCAGRMALDMAGAGTKLLKNKGVANV